MAINDTQKLDYLWKKLGYGVTKTDINSVKAATNESIASPLLLRGDKLWADSNLIPSTIPNASTAVVEIYDDSGNGSATIECSADLTSTPNRTWTTGITDWIPPEFGSTYQVKVYIDSASVAAPQSTGTQIFAAGSGNDDEWFFDYQSGVLHFIGTNLPSGISGNVIYIVGARYIGPFGSNSSSVSTDNIVANTAEIGSLKVTDLTNNRIVIVGVDGEVEDDANFTFDGTTFNIGAAAEFTVDVATGNTDVEGTLGVTGESTLASATVSDLTAGRVVLAGTSGAIEDSANLTFDGTLLTVTGNAEITGNLTLGGNITIGDADTDSITVTADFESSLIPDVDITYDLGSQSQRWNNIYGNSLSTVELQGGNIKVSGDTIENVVTDTGITISPNGTGTLTIDTASAVKLPVGDDSTRPSVAEEGQIRYNTTSTRVENFNADGAWVSLATEDDAIAFAIALG